MLLYCPVAWMLRPILKPIWPESEMGGTDSQSAGPDLMIPSVPAPVAKPRLERLTFGSVGCVPDEALRVKSTRASFTADGSKQERVGEDALLRSRRAAWCRSSHIPDHKCRD